MASVRTVFSEKFSERATLRYEATLQDETGAAVGSASVNALKLTLYDKRTTEIIEGINKIDILNTGRGTLSAAGALVVSLRPGDNLIVNARNKEEAHIMLLEWEYSNREKTGVHEIEFVLVNMHHRP